MCGCSSTCFITAPRLCCPAAQAGALLAIKYQRSSWKSGQPLCLCFSCSNCSTGQPGTETPEGSPLPLEWTLLSTWLDLRRGYILLLRAINRVNYSRCKQSLTWVTPSPSQQLGVEGKHLLADEGPCITASCALSPSCHTLSQMLYSCASVTSQLRGCSCPNVCLMGIFFFTTSLCTFWSSLTARVALQSWVSSRPWVNLVLSAFT